MTYAKSGKPQEQSRLHLLFLSPSRLVRKGKALLTALSGGTTLLGQPTSNHGTRGQEQID